ncbi:MAG: DUF2971 domain-containing protein [Flavobacterium sp.]|nr:DUF2971 domain-containing protein [Flavobacterium sp.]
MMWSHYADKHKGVCIELDEEMLVNVVKATAVNFKLEAINYSEKAKKSIYWQDDMGIEENILYFINAQYRDLAFKKSACWQEEDEKRLIVINEMQRVFISIKNAITGIYLGIDFALEYLPSIRKQIPSSVKLYQTVYQHYEFERWLLEEKER